MRIHGLLCIRNEVGRYLQRCLEWHSAVVDDLYVYDDQSTDDSVQVARNAGAVVDVRPDNRMSFLEHEGEFRQAAWEAFEIAINPDPGDWVLAFDADEFLVCPRSFDPAWLLRQTADVLTANESVGCRLRIHEVFDIADDGTPLIRFDGFWGGIKGVRFFEYRPGGRFANRKMGCGSSPFYVEPPEDSHCLMFLHFGYARPEDRVEKHNRYHGLQGHNPTHIASIIQKPDLMSWTGEAPF